jgi:uncharacterized protein (DUF1697 family)
VTTWVALLRGINVGRNKRISMADLRAMMLSLGYTDVRTHLQSGNAIFAAAERKPAVLEQELSAAIKRDAGMDVAVLIRKAADFGAVVDANPFVSRGVNTAELHATFLASDPPAAKLAAVDSAAYAPDEFAIGHRVIYLRLPNGVMGMRLPDWGKVLGQVTTTRNWNTTTRLRDLLGEAKVPQGRQRP